ncbi:MAG: hypothetical protein HKN19_01950 [Halioglobus sp.]|nr:hypothetical protein [Halioglobus sp.]
MNIRQLALVANNLGETQAHLFKLLGIERGFHDPEVAQFGLHNVVMRIGDAYLEVVAPMQDDTTAGRFLERRGGDSGYMVLVQVDNLARERARIAASDIRIVWEVDSGTASGMHLHPKDVPGAIASLDQMVPPQKWFWAGAEGGDDLPPARHVGGIAAAEIRSADPDAAAACWSRAYGVDVTPTNAGPDIVFDATLLRFRTSRDTRGAGLAAIDLYAHDFAPIAAAAAELGIAVRESSLDYCGTRFNFVPPP